jgi:hypothetical protein
MGLLYLEIDLNLLEPSGPVKACNGIALPCSVVRMLTSAIFYEFVSELCGKANNFVLYRE